MICIQPPELLHPTEYYSWDRYLEDYDEQLSLDDLSWSPPKDFDKRFYYYPESVPLTMELSRDELQETTDEAEYAECNAYMLTEMPSIQVRLIPRTHNWATVEGNGQHRKKNQTQ